MYDRDAERLRMRDDRHDPGSPEPDHRVGCAIVALLLAIIIALVAAGIGGNLL